MTDRLERLNRYHQERYGDRSVVGLNKSARIRAELFARWVGTGQRLLEIGCGAGALLELYARDNRVTALDVDKPALEECGRRLGVETVWADFSTHLPFGDGAFDVVVAGETLEHMPYPSIILDEVRRVLVPGGLFVGSVPNAYRYRNRLAVLRGQPIDDDPTHMQFYSLASLRALLARAFSVEEIVPVRGKLSHRFPSLFAHNLAFRCRRAEGEGARVSS